jgi:hypothetical protein
MGAGVQQFDDARGLKRVREAMQFRWAQRAHRQAETPFIALFRFPILALMKQAPNPIFYGLLYLDQNKKRNSNIRGGGDPFDIYLRCAGLCARSVAYHNYRFRLVTNDRRRIERRIRQLGITQMDVLEQEFALNVPEYLQFRAAHFKLELYKHFGSGAFGDHVGIIDVDSVMTAPIDFPPLPPGAILAYDITDQVLEEYGRDRVHSDLERVSGKQLSQCRWFGGEFLFGHAESFQRLAASVFRLWPKYIEHVRELHHVGDEMLVAAAISGANLQSMDAGELGFVARWWTARTHFKQLPFDVIMKRSILHLPADKRFLADSGNIPFCPINFIGRFRRVARGKLFRRKLYNVVQALLGREGKYVARLSQS